MATQGSSQQTVEIVPTGWDAQFAHQYGYSFGRLRHRDLWIAGQVSVDEMGEPLGRGDIEAQTRRVYERIRTIVESAGGSMTDIVKTTTYITDRDFRPVTNELRREYFPGPPFPCNTLVIVAGLALPEYLVEVEAEAVLADE